MSSSLGLAAAAGMRSRQSQIRQYLAPPVHEVVFSLVFDSPVDRQVLEALPHLLESELPNRERRDVTAFGVTFGPGGQQVTAKKPEFDGWVFRDAAPTRVLVASRKQLTFHAVRPGEWPSGEYAGWQLIEPQLKEVLTLLREVYANCGVRRAGLRYLNRVAVPRESEFEDWFRIGFTAPTFLRDPYAINLRQTWARIDSSDDLSATIGLATIEIPDPSLQSDHAGLLFDIEVFNLWVQHAPSYDELPAWFTRAHDVENDIFESSITEALRERLKVIKP
jgi:uncharacterized protein (TIGR04255 family)